MNLAILAAVAAAVTFAEDFVTSVPLGASAPVDFYTRTFRVNSSHDYDHARRALVQAATDFAFSLGVTSEIGGFCATGMLNGAITTGYKVDVRWSVPHKA